MNHVVCVFTVGIRVLAKIAVGGTERSGEIGHAGQIIGPIAVDAVFGTEHVGRVRLLAQICVRGKGRPVLTRSTVEHFVDRIDFVVGVDIKATALSFDRFRRDDAGLSGIGAVDRELAIDDHNFGRCVGVVRADFHAAFVRVYLVVTVDIKGLRL